MWRVLVISQHIGLRTLLTTLFKRGGHHVDAVTSRAEAVPIIAHGLPNLIILDLYLSDEPGLDLASDLRARYPQLPMLFISSTVLDAPVPEEDIHAAAQLGINIFQRSIASHDFNSVIQDLLNRA
jgi:CheY-like chemotaxis protein